MTPYDWIRYLWSWRTDAWRYGFKCGRCSWCGRYRGIVPGESLCEECWLESK